MVFYPASTYCIFLDMIIGSRADLSAIVTKLEKPPLQLDVSIAFAHTYIGFWLIKNPSSFVFIEFLSWQMSCIVIDGGGSFIMSTRGFSAMRHAPVVGIDSSCIAGPYKSYHLFRELGLFQLMTNNHIWVVWLEF